MSGAGVVVVSAARSAAADIAAAAPPPSLRSSCRLAPWARASSARHSLPFAVPCFCRPGVTAANAVRRFFDATGHRLLRSAHWLI